MKPVGILPLCVCGMDVYVRIYVCALCSRKLEEDIQSPGIGLSDVRKPLYGVGD